MVIVVVPGSVRDIDDDVTCMQRCLHACSEVRLYLSIYVYIYITFIQNAVFPSINVITDL